jgi:arylsulfate sulfotransferase
LKNSQSVGFFLAAALFSSSVSLIGCGAANYISLPPAVVSRTAHPLVAQYSIRHVHSGLTAWVEFGTDTTYGRQTSTFTNSVTSPSGQMLNILVAGMLPQTTYHMRAHVNWPGGSWVDGDHTFRTGALNASQAASALQLPVISVSPPGLTPAPGVELLSLGNPPNTSMLEALVTDLQGNIIWYYPFGGAFPIKLMPNGHMILQMNGDLREIDLAGTTIRDVSVAQLNQSLEAKGYSFSIGAFSHDVLTLPNGHWVTIGVVSKIFTDLPGYPGTTNVTGDAVVDIDPNGNVVWGWSAFDHLDVNRHLQGLPDWTHSNALVYTADGNLLISMRHQSWILKLDYSNGTGTGNILWKLGEDGDFNLSGGDPSQWFYGQHDPVILSTSGEQTTMAVYDDGNLRIDAGGVACGSSASAPACYSRAVILEIDEGTRIASVLWQDLPGFFSPWGGSIGTLSNGDVEFDSSQPSGAVSSQIMEVTPADIPQTVWQMHISGEWAYRGKRIPSLYPGVTWQ